MIKRHVAPGVAVPLHPEAAAFADHYGFSIDVLAAYRPTGKGRVERQVNIVRDHVLAGRTFDSIAELDGAFAAWLPIRRGQVHRTHGQVIGVRAEADRAALRPLPDQPYLVTEKHLRRVGKDCLISFEASATTRSRPAQSGPGSESSSRSTASRHHPCPAHRTGTAPAPSPAPTPRGAGIDRPQAAPAAHPRHAANRGMVDPAHWDGAARRADTRATDSPNRRPTADPNPHPSRLAGRVPTRDELRTRCSTVACWPAGTPD